MTDLIRFISENKEWIFSGIGATILTVCVTIGIKHNKSNNKKKKDDLINIKINNLFKNNNQSTNNNKQNNSYAKRNETLNSSKVSRPKKNIEVEKIRLYSTGAKGKVYTNIFHKSLNHNFGVEIRLRNNTSQLQNVKIGWCIYDEKGSTLLNGTFNKKINPYSSINTDFYAKEKSFLALKPGKYKSQFWVNDQRVQKEFFTISYK